MLVMCSDLIRLYTLRQSDLPFKSAIEGFPIFRSIFLALSLPCDAEDISLGLNMNVFRVNARKIDSDNIIAILAVCFHPRGPVAERILRVRSLEESTE